MLLKIKKGFTLFESLLVVTLLGSVSIGVIMNQIDNNKQINKIRFLEEASSIIKAVDNRIAIDGYDPDLWGKLSWNNEEDIVNNLINGELTSRNISNCTGGTWNPSMNSESDTKLIECGLWKERKKTGEKMSAQIRVDSSGFIQGFDLYIDFIDVNKFKENFQNIKYALNRLNTGKSQELSGIHMNHLVSQTTRNNIETYQCVSDPTNCGIKLSLERSGGNEYLRADGGNSMIGDHLSFIESKGESPLKCIRWSNTIRDGSGVWSMVDAEDCGIGIYEKTGQPVMVETVTDTGTFKNILLDQNCHYYRWNGSNVVNTGTTKPCGMSNDGSEIYQVIPNISVETLNAETIYGSGVYTKSLIADTISGDTLEALDELKTDLIGSYTENGVIEVSSNMSLKEALNIEKELYVAGDSSFSGELKLNKVNNEDMGCTTNGALSRTANGTLLNCVSGLWKSAVKDMTPVGTVTLWASTSIPTGWVEMRGQSTSPYPELKALIGDTIPDMRGTFVRGWDNGRGLDSGRSLRSYQDEALNSSGLTFRGNPLPAHSHWNGGLFRNNWANSTNMPYGWRSRSNSGYSSAEHHEGRGQIEPRTSTESSGTPTGTIVGSGRETRPKNMALMYIIKVSS